MYLVNAKSNFSQKNDRLSEFHGDNPIGKIKLGLKIKYESEA